jgi:APA family basic amino acid/polyamine antiporter
LEKKPPVFVREATGLIREVGAWPSFMATIMLVTGGVPVLWVATMYTAPGANWPLAFFIAFLPTLLMAGLFTIIGISMPRSGGDYVFTTRAINPYVGFLNYWGVNIAYILNIGIFSFYTGTYFGYLLASFGAFYNDVGLLNMGAYLAEPIPSFVLATVWVIFVSLLAMLRPRYSWGTVFWAGIITIVTTVIMYGALAGIDASSFAASYNSFMGNATAYDAVIQTGGVTPPSDSLLATAAALPFVWFSYTWYNLPTSWSGEMKNVRKSMPIAILVAIGVIAAYYIVLTVIVTHAFGQSFLDNWGSLAANGTAPVGGIGGFLPFFALLVYKNPLLFIVMFVALWLPNTISLAPCVIAQTRYIFAWAFDRILPEPVASVSERFHTPVVATVLVMIGALISVGLMAFLPNSGEYALLSFTMFSFSFIIPGLAAVIFPFRKSEVYENVFLGKKKFVLPLLSWLGLGSAIYLIYSTYLANQSGSLPIDSFSITMYGTIYVLGALVLVVGYLRTRSKGLPLSLVFKELPPE